MMVLRQSEFLSDVCRLIGFAQSQGFIVTGGELYRPPEMQKLYVEQGKSKTLAGRHQDRLAIDLHFFKKDKDRLVMCSFEDTEVAGKYWQSLNVKNRWGGYFKTLVDTPHFERSK